MSRELEIDPVYVPLTLRIFLNDPQLYKCPSWLGVEGHERFLRGTNVPVEGHNP